MEGGEKVWPPHEILEVGEAVAVKTRAVLGRQARSRIRIRVVGARSFAWLEAAMGWGATLEAVVVDHSWHCNQVKLQLPGVSAISLKSATYLPPAGRYDGILVASIHHQDEADNVATVFAAWRPAVALLAYPPSVNKRQAIRWLPDLNQDSYRKKIITCSHAQFGGVTSSTWRVVHVSRLSTCETLPSVMKTNFYQRPLQTALDDTVGEERVASFDPREEKGRPSFMGYVTPVHGSRQLEVYSATGLAPDISCLGHEDRHFWVSANSVMRPGGKVLRPVKTHELFAIWDYEGKLESKEWSREYRQKRLNARLGSPPAKVVRLFLFKACDGLLARTKHWNTDVAPSGIMPTVGLTADVPFSPLEDKATARLEAKQADDAAIDKSHWAPPDETPVQAKAREVLRRLAVKWWALNLEREGLQWLNEHGNTKYDREIVEDCIRRAKAATYWEWVRGSRLFFWRFSDEFLADMRDGVPFFHWADGPTGFQHNLPAPSREAEIAARKKIFKLRFQNYMEKGELVQLLVPRFSIVKIQGDGGEVLDIRVIFDSKSNGHNATLWASSFMLDEFADVLEHVVKWLAMSVGQYLEMGSPKQNYDTQPANTFTKTKQADIDVGQMFHNFPAHRSERSRLGVRYISTRNDGLHEPHSFYRFTRLHFGGTSSPWLACQAEARIIEECKGDRTDPDNHWQWDRVHLNLFTAPNYDCSMPRVMLLRADGEVATREATFMDDTHVSGRDKDDTEDVRAACHQMRVGMNSRGNQADCKKYRPPVYCPGAWIGCVLHTDTPFPMKSTTAKKWKRFKDGLGWIAETSNTAKVIGTAELRRIAGLGVNVTEVYTDCRPYLKGFFNAIEAFRWGRDVDGWRLLNTMELAEALETSDAGTREAQADYPLETVITAELDAHVRALMTLFESESSLACPIRPTDPGKFRIVIGDASAEGFGAGTQYPDLSFEAREGLWLESFAEGGSNLREAQNIVNHLLREIRSGKHDGCEILQPTDNAVWSYVWTKGMSTAKHLFNLTLELKVEARKHEVYIRTCHISGERMIASGIDGLSRGNYNAGVSLGFDVRDFLPLHLTAWDVSGPALEAWCKSWMGLDYSPPLEPEGWFEKGHKSGVHIWAPPPAAGYIVMKELARSRLKRPWRSTHVVMIPRLLYQEEWRSRFEKEVDLWFVLYPESVWPHSAFEPLMVGIRFPLSRSFPWEVKLERDKVVDIGRSLSSLSRNSHVRVGHYLRKLWGDPRALPSV